MKGREGSKVEGERPKVKGREGEGGEGQRTEGGGGGRLSWSFIVRLRVWRGSR